MTGSMVPAHATGSVVVVVLAGARPGRVDRELCAERVHMPFPRVAGLFVGSERWSGLGCLLQVRVRLRTALSKVCCRVSRKTQ
jgi:hypothetical protein